MRGIRKQTSHASKDHDKVIRRNILEAWKLGKSQQKLEEKKKKLKSSVQRIENDLIVETDKIHRTSGNMVCDTHVVTSCLPSVIVSPATTSRSKLPWEKFKKLSVTRQMSSLSSVSSKPTIRRNNSQPCRFLPALPRLHTVIKESKQDVSSVSSYCRRITYEHDRRVNVDDVNKRTAKETRELPSNLLQIPSQKQDKSMKEILEKWKIESQSNECHVCEGASAALMEKRRSRFKERSATVSW